MFLIFFYFARRGDSNEYLQSMFWSQKKKIRKTGIPPHTPVLLYTIRV